MFLAHTGWVVTFDLTTNIDFVKESPLDLIIQQPSGYGYDNVILYSIIVSPKEISGNPFLLRLTRDYKLLNDNTDYSKYPSSYTPDGIDTSKPPFIQWKLRAKVIKSGTINEKNFDLVKGTSMSSRHRFDIFLCQGTGVPRTIRSNGKTIVDEFYPVQILLKEPPEKQPEPLIIPFE